MRAYYDGDMLVYRLCAAVQENCPFDKDVVISADYEETWRCIQLRLEECLTQLREEGYEPTPIICFSDPNVFRYDVYPTYKGRGTDKARPDKPVLYSEMVAKVKRNYECIQWEGLEADDVMGICQEPDGTTCIVSGDKDMKQCAGIHLNLIDPEEGTTEITPEEGNLLFLKQILAGDPTDGYYGVPRVGLKTAHKYLQGALEQDSEGLWEHIVNKYKEKDLDESDALLNARMAYILQEQEDYDLDTHKVNLWTPNKLKPMSSF